MSNEVSPEWIKWARKKWRERVMNHRFLSAETKVHLLKVEEQITEGRTRFSFRAIEKAGDTEDMRTAINEAFAFSLLEHRIYQGNPFFQLSQPMSLLGWAGMCEQKHLRQKAEKEGAEK